MTAPTPLDVGTEFAAAGQGTGFTATETISAGATCAFVFVYLQNTPGITLSSVVWSGGGGEHSNGSCDKIASVPATNGSVEVWGIVSPTAAVGGTFTVNWAGGAISRVSVNSVSWQNSNSANVASCFTNAIASMLGATDTPSVSVTTAAGNTAIGYFFDDSNLASSISPGHSETQIYQGVTGRSSLCERLATSAGTTAMTGQDGGAGVTNMGSVAFQIVAAGGGGGGTRTPTLILMGVG